MQLGMASTLKTLCGQSHEAQRPHFVRSWIVLFVCSLLILPIFVFTTPFLKLLGQEEYIAEMAGRISLWYIPVMFSYMWLFTLQIYLEAQSKKSLITCWAVLAFALHLSLSWFMTVELELGLPGVMVSMILAMWLPVLGQLSFVLFGGCPETWTGFSRQAFKDLRKIFKLSLSSGIMLCLDIDGWAMMISVGFSAAAGYLHYSQMLHLIALLVAGISLYEWRIITT